MFKCVGKAVKSSMRLSKALVAVLWLAFLVTPAYFALRPEVRSVSIWPVTASLGIGLLLARFGPYRTKLFSFQGLGPTLLVLGSGLLLLVGMALSSAEGLVPNAAQVGSWLWNSLEGFAAAIAKDFGRNLVLYVFLFLFALTEGVWFRGIWFAMFPNRLWVSIGLGSALCAGWYALVTHELMRAGYRGPAGLQWLLPMFLAAIVFGIVRFRGGSWLLMALADWLLQIALYINTVGGVSIHFGHPGNIALYLGAFLLLLWGLLGSRPAPGILLPRSRLQTSGLCVTFILVAFASAGWAILNSPFRASPKTREQAWEMALDYFAVELPKRHVDFHMLMPQSHFVAQVSELKSRVRTLTDDQTALEVRRIIAQLRVAHSEFHWNFVRLPITIGWLSDGSLVMMASREYQDAIGCRVVRFGAMTPDEVRSRLAPYISHENEAWLNAALMNGEASNQALLERIGVFSPEGCLPLTLERPDGTIFTMEIWPLAPNSKWQAPDQAHMLPGVRLNAELRYYEVEYGTKDQVLLITFRRTEEDPRYSFATFEADLNALASKHPVERMVVDLRENMGGTSGAMGAFMDILRRSAAFRAKTPPLVLIGKRTYSGGVIIAAGIKGEFGGILIGEPTGGKPVFYANAKTLLLPHGKGRVSYSTVKVPAGSPEAASLQPDLEVPITIADMRAGRSAAYEAALRYPLPSGKSVSSR